jgi:hypothetical protein
MLTYKYIVDEVNDRPLIPVRQKEGKRSLLAVFSLLPILLMISTALILFSPIKIVQLIIEKVFNK